MGDAEEPGVPVLVGAEVGLAVGCSAPPALFPSVAVGEALAEKTCDGGTVATAPVGEGVLPAKPRPSRLGLAVGAEDWESPPPKESGSVVGEALGEKKYVGGTVAVEPAPVGEGAIPAKPRPPGLGLAVGADDRGSAPSKYPSSAVVGEALAEESREGGAVAEPVGGADTPSKPRLPELGLGVGPEGWSLEGAGEGCPSIASSLLVGAGDDAEDCCSSGLDASPVGDNVGAGSCCGTGVELALAGNGDGAVDGSCRVV